MKKSILYTDVNKAELVSSEIPVLGEYDVQVRTYYTTVSPGTEKANITGDPNVTYSGRIIPFPRSAGYSSSGVVEAIGSRVTSVKPGDRVIPFWSKHTNINIVPEENVVKILDDRISFRTAAAMFIATFPLAALRKTGLEIGESCMIMGLGLLGQYAVRLAKYCGATPVIAADPIEERRKDALAGGADFALNPLEEGFAEEVRKLTFGGVNSAIEVTGIGAGLDETLDCMAKMGRVALLGCTRDKNFVIDYYKKVHGPGVSLIGAHTNARPREESYPGHFSHRDDLMTLQKLYLLGRLDIDSMLGPVYSPDRCQEVYSDLITNKNFPMLVQFDWQNVD